MDHVETGEIMRILNIIAAAALCALLPFGAQAEAQTAKYYARTALVPAPAPAAPQYVATYASTWSACSGGKQTKAVATCKKDGVAVALTFCTAQVQDCKSCANVARNFSYTGGIATPLGAFRNGSDLTPACAAMATSLKSDGICYWDMRGGSTDGPAWFVAGGVKATGAYGELGSICS